MNIVKGDLIDLALNGKFDVIIHGCNCQCTMGAGIAKQIKIYFPEAYQADLETIKGDRSKLGTISQATIQRGSLNLTIVNGYTQFDWRGSGCLLDYSALQSVMRHVKQNFSGKRIGYPKIGAGLAWGEWKRIASLIDQELIGEDHTLVEYPSF
jgi:O-acetyl-ADP-ribose deacetylase (regulator of RNase III)